jgi:hypothetical protein
VRLTVQHPPFAVGATQTVAVVCGANETHAASDAPVWKTQVPIGHVDPGGVVATVPVATLAEASPLVKSTVMLPRLVLLETVSAVPAVDAAWKLSVATVLPAASCTKQPKATPCAAKVTETLPEESAVPDAATGGDPNVTQ